MSSSSIYAGLTGLLLLCSACAGRMRHSTDPCDRSQLGVQAAYDSSKASSLAGDYRLTIVSDWEDDAGKFVDGKLVLQLNDTLHRRYERIFTGTLRRVDDRPLWVFQIHSVTSAPSESDLTPRAVWPDRAREPARNPGRREGSE